MDVGIESVDLPEATGADEVLANRDGTLVRVPAYALRAQLAIGTGRVFRTWAELAVQTGSIAGQRAEVYGDAGTHMDAFGAGAVQNTGLYGWSTAPEGWRWISSVDPNGINTALAEKAPLASPALTGAPTAPTPAAGDSSTKIATTAFVQGEQAALLRPMAAGGFRPGDAPARFSGQKNGLPHVMPALSVAGIQIGADGASYRVAGAGVVALREAIWMPPGRSFRCRTYYRRVTDPSDPINDAVRTSIAWLDANGALITTQVMATDSGCTVAAGRRVQSFDLPANGAAFARLYVETFGSDGVTDIQHLVFQDITDAPATERLYDGTWNASTNTPTLSSGVGVDGHYRIVSTAGSTLIDGVSSWQVGDWIIFNGATWERVPVPDASSGITIAGANGITVTRSNLAFTIDINVGSMLSAWLDTLPTDPTPLSAGDWWNNGGIPTRA